MRAFVIGSTGSMGRRRVRDLERLGVTVEGWDPLAGRMSVSRTPDFVVISTPPLTHKQFTTFGAFPIFTEADVEAFPDPHFPSCTPRFNPTIVRMKERLGHGEIGRPVAYTLHVGQHLADWQPGRDLTTYYAAKRETGACREMVPFELGWLTWLFGPMTKAKALRANTAGIADIDDVYQVVVEHGGNGSAPVLGHLLIDVVSRPPFRVCTVIGTDGSFVQQIRYTEAVYLAEMRAFVAAVEGRKPWPYSLAEEAAVLETLTTIERFA